MHETMNPAKRANPRRTRRARGFTLIEVMTVVVLLGTLTALSYAYFRDVPRAVKVSSGAMELMGEISSAKAQAYGRNIRVAVLIYAAPNGPIQYWTVLDPWFTLTKAMATTPGWTKPQDLVPPSGPIGSIYRPINKGQLDPVVSFVPAGYQTVVNSTADSLCVAQSADYALGTGTGGGHNYFPPPYCMVPDDLGCTFCTVSSGTTRGALIFEPEGALRLTGSNGVDAGAGAGSITLSALNLPNSKGVALTFTSSGLLHTFRGPK